MNDEQAVRVASASLMSELGAGLRQVVAQSRADDATARQTTDEQTTSRLNRIEQHLEAISAQLSSRSALLTGITARRLNGFFLGLITGIAMIVVVAGIAIAGAKVVGDRAFASGRAVGYQQAAVLEQEHPGLWRAYRRSTISLRSRYLKDSRRPPTY